MKRSKNVCWGVLFLLGAVAAIVGGMGLIEGIGFWTILFGIVLAGIFIEGLVRGSFGQILFSAAFLVILVGKVMGGLPISVWLVLGAALLGTIGLNILFPRKYRHMHYIASQSFNREEYNQVIEGDGGEVVNCEVAFGSSSKYITSQCLKKANLEVSFGAMSVYYDNAVLWDNSAAASLEVAFGELELYIPQNWKVVTNVTSSFGHVEEIGSFNPDGINMLILVGEVSFGSLKIHYI